VDRSSSREEWIKKKQIFLFGERERRGGWSQGQDSRGLRGGLRKIRGGEVSFGGASLGHKRYAGGGGKRA